MMPIDAKYSIHSLGKTVTFYDLEGNKFEATLVGVHVESEDILYQIPRSIADDIPPGSIAFTTGGVDSWQKNFSGTWEAVEN